MVGRRKLFAMLALAAAMAVGPARGLAQVELSEKDRKTLERGEYTKARWVGGGLLSLYPGFGVGQAAQGRWGDVGWVFTAGELIATGLIIAGSRDRGELLDAGIATALVFRGLEMLDAWIVPPIHNRRYRKLKEKMEGASVSFTTPRDGRLSVGIQVEF